MKNNLFLFLFCFLLQHIVWAQHNALHFDGIDDYVELSPLPITKFAPNSDYTAQVWFKSESTLVGSCATASRTLLSLGTTGSDTNISDCSGILTLYHPDGIGGYSGPISMLPIRDGLWHCVALVRNAGTISVWLDGGTSPIYTGPTAAVLNTTQFRVGTWSSAASDPTPWQGTIDEIRLWSRALTTAELSICPHCTLTGAEPGLVCDWALNQGIAGGVNIGIATSFAFDPDGDNGSLYNFLRNGPTSNFIASGAPMLPSFAGTTLEIRGMLPSVSPIITEVCAGEPAHFCLKKSGIVLSTPPSLSIVWEESNDGGSTWATAPAAFSGPCFSVPSITADCNVLTNPDGITDRRYRATITVTDPLLGSCTYTTAETNLRICCPIPATTVNVTIAPPSLLSGTLCEGDVADFTVSIAAPLFTGGTIDWCIINGGLSLPLPGFMNMTSFTITGVTVLDPKVCFKAVIKQCSKTKTLETCIDVDEVPVCGVIDKDPLCTTLLPPLTPCPPGMTCYSICPGNDGLLYQSTPFTMCTPQWQYSFDCLAWNNLGFSNAVQNTNELTGDWVWPSGAPGAPIPPVFYQVSCLPLSAPSGCEPCQSNKLRIEFISPPAPDVIVGLNQICVEDGGTLLSMALPVAGLTYTWWCNGIQVQSGSLPTYFATMGGCYWVEISNGCQTVRTPNHCIRVCELIAAISCPLPPNDCATTGVPIVLDACVGTKNTCGGDPSTFTYVWSWPGGSGTGCTITDTPPVAGITYTVTVTDPATGCTDMASITIVPCTP